MCNNNKPNNKCTLGVVKDIYYIYILNFIVGAALLYILHCTFNNKKKVSFAFHLRNASEPMHNNELRLADFLHNSPGKQVSLNFFDFINIKKIHGFSSTMPYFLLNI